MSRATAHAKHAYYCSCGRLVHGNGGKASHAYMHESRRDDHHWITPTLWRERFGLKLRQAGDVVDVPGHGNITIDHLATAGTHWIGYDGDGYPIVIPLEDGEGAA